MFEEIRDRIIIIFTSRLTILYLGLVALCGVLLYRCFSLQIINGESYLENFVLEQEKTRDIVSTRGNIYDRNGNLLAYSQLAYSVKVEDTFESGSAKNAELNEMLLRLIRFVEKNGDHVTTDFKIVVNEDDNFEFSAEGRTLQRFLADVYDHSSISDLTQEEASSTAMEVMQYLSRRTGKGFHYAVGDFIDPEDRDSFVPGRGYSRSDWLKVVTIRFAMSQTAYRKYIGTTVATDISQETVAVILENSDVLPGVTIEEDTIRRYVDSPYFAHLLGYVGKISSDEMEDLNNRRIEEGMQPTYTINDVVGKGGIESYMETTLQGEKGYERVMVDNTGKVISVLERENPSAGQNVYLTVDKDLTIAAYCILEQKLAGLISSKIIDAREYNSKSDIKIPIYDVYYAMFGNGILNIEHFGSASAQETEQEVYRIYMDYQNETYDALRQELTDTRTPYKELDAEKKVYESSLVKLLTDSGILMGSKVDAEDAVYQDWAKNEVISLGEYLDYCIYANWIDTSKLSLEGKYSDSSEIFDKIVDSCINLADHSGDFQKRMFKYMLLKDRITPKQVCMLLYEQNAIEIPIEEIEKLQEGRISAFRFMMNRIEGLDVTPAQLALDPCNASVVITDVHTGEVLAMVTYPGYDNNKMANSVDPVYYEKLTADKSSPLLNFATQYKAAPGSTYKIVTASAGLMENVIDLWTKIDCVSLFTAVTPSPSCWSRFGHGDETVRTAIRDSCNYFFFDVGYRLSTKSGEYKDAEGIETLSSYADLFGLSEKSGVEISEYEPNVSDMDAVRSSIGQGTNSYTTTQLARYAATIANRGTCYDLTLLGRVESADGTKVWEQEPSVRNTIDFPTEYWDAFHQGMRAVVENKKYFGDLAVNVAGKTGTAEQTKSRPNHALFICFAPYEQPEIAMATRVPFGYSSDYAAQISRDIIKYYYGLAEEDDLITGTADTPDAGVTNEM
ncbi:MAG: penicillin-binding protein [Lachnospiraceae bacterium]|nr:penicillin-binding protein [Lachnospiraceae bacterium]